MRFTNLHMKDFRGTRELKIGFETDVTVIVGRNGAGKTSILDALAIVVGMARNQFRETNLFGIGLRPYNRDVREDAVSARLEVACEVGDHRLSHTPVVNTLEVEIDRNNSYRDILDRKDAKALDKLASSHLLLVYYRQERGFGPVRRIEKEKLFSDFLDPEVVQDHSLLKDLRAIDDLGAWWDQRDAQEARRVRDGERDYRDPQLDAIRKLIEKIDSFLGIVFNSTELPPGLHFVKNDGTRVHVSGLSGGERSYIILLADLARRLQVFAPGKPLEEIPAIVLIDEVELHLHPGWQSEIVPTLTDVFRACQFIVTTHSPQVLSGVESAKVRIIEEDVPDWSWKVTVPLSTRGRTSDYLLEGVLGARDRFPPLRELIGTFNTAIDQGDISKASRTLERLEKEIAEDAPTLLVLRKRLKKLRSGK